MVNFGLATGKLARSQPPHCAGQGVMFPNRSLQRPIATHGGSCDPAGRDKGVFRERDDEDVLKASLAAGQDKGQHVSLPTAASPEWS